MLVFLSDVHLTDGSSGETIRPTAFRVFADNLLKLAETVAPLEELRLVLLGDIFDIIRSGRWRPFAEAKVRSGEAGYVLYGHTHEHLILPMDQVPLAGGTTLDKIYFNTGTWRKTWNKASFEHVNREFIGWHVLTYVTIFRPTENRQYNFEVWNGALG